MVRLESTIKAGLILNVLKCFPVASMLVLLQSYCNIAVMSLYRQSGGENAGLWTEVSTTEPVLKEQLRLWLEDIQLRRNN